MEEDNTELVLSLPPYDQFGMKSFIKKNNIFYVSLGEAILRVIKSAKSSLSISSPFLDLEGIPEIKKELLTKAFMDVKIKILVRAPLQRKLKEDSIKSFLKLAEKSGSLKNVEIRLYHYEKQPYVKSSTHAKFIIADGNYMYIGSGELRENSIKKNFEAGLLRKGKEVKELEKVFLELFDKAGRLK
jgi:phosphatidylserine/phosphatidylglycerophosphate/cardiolipin synthase-like enzyme